MDDLSKPERMEIFLQRTLWQNRRKKCTGMTYTKYAHIKNLVDSHVLEIENKSKMLFQKEQIEENDLIPLIEELKNLNEGAIYKCNSQK
jgi:ATP-dependent Zn protease